MKNNTRPIGRRLAAIRHDIRGDRQARTERRALQAELASYTSASDLNDLEAILDRHQHATVRRMAVHRAHRMNDARLDRCWGRLGDHALLPC